MGTRAGKAALPLIILAAVVLISGLLSDASLAGKDSFKPHKLTILFTGDDWGNVKPCG